MCIEIDESSVAIVGLKTNLLTDLGDDQAFTFIPVLGKILEWTDNVLVLTYEQKINY